MMTDELIEIMKTDPDLAELGTHIRSGHLPALVNGVCENALPLFCRAVTKYAAAKPLIIVPDEKSAYGLAKRLEEPDEKPVLVFPARDLMFDRVSASSKEFEQERLKVLSAIRKGEYSAVIAVPDSVMQYTVSPEELTDAEFRLTSGERADIDNVVSRLIAAGYTRCETVEGAGQFSRRGGILDVFSPSAEYPCRIDFFGDEIDGMGIFDTVSQRRIENVAFYDCMPVGGAECGNLPLAAIRDEILALIKSGNADDKALAELKKDLGDVEGGRLPEAKDRYYSVLCPGAHTVFDYMPGCICIVTDAKRTFERARAWGWQTGQTLEELTNRGVIAYKNAAVTLFEDELFARLSGRTVVFDYFYESRKTLEYAARVNINTKTASAYAGDTEQFASDISGTVTPNGYVLLYCMSSHAADAATIAVEAQNMTVVRDGPLRKNCVNIRVSEREGEAAGFELPGCRLTVLCDTGSVTEAAVKKLRSARRRFKKSERITSYADLNVGDYVVHANHGIGVYAGMTELTVEGAKKDYLRINYAGNDVLYVPCNQLDMVSKYIGGSDDGRVKVTKLSSQEWQRAKSRAKAAAKDIAKELIALYAARQNRQGYAFGPDTEMQDEFEAMFEWPETDGQLQAASEIKKDMQDPHPMDRLLCGDVGFGKTEVSLRAAFKAVDGGKQVAVLVPTTILAMQHYNTMLSRFRGFPVKIEMLSRFVSKKDQDDTKADIKSGKADIVVGTHKLLQKDIEFRSLGLLIIDEEQRFGVTHKEKLKMLSENVDSLTLTATPIPRTLNMALSGIRDMSVLEEAPQDRMPVQSYVLEHDEAVIGEAIRRELRRGGQVFYLHNLVDTIYSKAEELGREFPQAVIAIAHGKMDKDELSDVWKSMVEGEIDILVCTTIIETGVDIPNANTLIIEDADRMGLSQLHQIRGRVGRSSRRAYAYFTYRPGAILTEIASKRLEAIKEFTEFGSGFKIAMRDLELRGAGNILGAEQSGHMADIGYDLYIKILEEAVNEEKGIVLPKKEDCQVDILCDAYIPDEYIPSGQVRIDMYRKIASIASPEDEDEILDELYDRFGEPPVSVTNLLKISLIRNSAAESGIKNVSQKQGIISFYPTEFDMRRCVEFAALPEVKGRVMISTAGKPYFSVKTNFGENSAEIAETAINAYKSLKSSINNT